MAVGNFRIYYDKKLKKATISDCLLPIKCGLPRRIVEPVDGILQADILLKIRIEIIIRSGKELVMSILFPE